MRSFKVSVAKRGVCVLGITKERLLVARSGTRAVAGSYPAGRAELNKLEECEKFQVIPLGRKHTKYRVGIKRGLGAWGAYQQMDWDCAGDMEVYSDPSPSFSPSEAVPSPMELESEYMEVEDDLDLPDIEKRCSQCGSEYKETDIDVCDVFLPDLTVCGDVESNPGPGKKGSQEAKPRQDKSKGGAKNPSHSAGGHRARAKGPRRDRVTTAEALAAQKEEMDSLTLGLKDAIKEARDEAAAVVEERRLITPEDLAAALAAVIPDPTPEWVAEDEEERRRLTGLEGLERLNFKTHKPAKMSELYLLAIVWVIAMLYSWQVHGLFSIMAKGNREMQGWYSYPPREMDLKLNNSGVQYTSWWLMMLVLVVQLISNFLIVVIPAIYLIQYLCGGIFTVQTEVKWAYHIDSETDDDYRPDVLNMKKLARKDPLLCYIRTTRRLGLRWVSELYDTDRFYVVSELSCRLSLISGEILAQCNNPRLMRSGADYKTTATRIRDFIASHQGDNVNRYLMDTHNSHVSAVTGEVAIGFWDSLREKEGYWLNQ